MDKLTHWSYPVSVSIGPPFDDALALLQTMGAEAEPKDAKARTRARLLAAASELFQRRGYRHTSIDDVAREAGLGKGTVYLHFKSKQELLLHVVAEEKKKYVSQFLPLLQENLPPAERFFRYMELSLTVLQRSPLMSKLLSGDRELLMALQDLDSGVDESIRKAQRDGIAALLRGVGAWDQLSPEEQEDRVAALSAMVLASGQMMDERQRGGVDPKRFAQQLAKIIAYGVGAP